MTNALAKLEVDPGPAFIAALGKEAAARMPDFSPQDLSVSLVSMARLGHDPSPAFLHAALAAAHQMLPRCNAQVRTYVHTYVRSGVGAGGVRRGASYNAHISFKQPSFPSPSSTGPVPPHHGPGAVGGAAPQGLPQRLHGPHPAVPARLPPPGPLRFYSLLASRLEAKADDKPLPFFHL